MPAPKPNLTKPRSCTEERLPVRDGAERGATVGAGMRLFHKHTS